MAGLLVEQLFNAPSFVDVSVALNDPTLYQDVQQVADAEPDYLMWGEDPASPYYVVECKGCQTNSSTSMDQLRRGLEQVPSLIFGAGARAPVTLVIATCMEEDRTTVYVLDPPNDDPANPHPPDNSQRKKISERTDKRTWRITDPEAFERRTQLAKESELLKWAGQFSKALNRDARLAPMEHPPKLQDFDLDIRKTNIASYRGYLQPLFPQLGYPHLRLFTGVEEELLASIQEGAATVRETAKAIQNRVAEQKLNLESPYESLSRNGTCMIIEGLG